MIETMTAPASAEPATGPSRGTGGFGPGRPLTAVDYVGEDGVLRLWRGRAADYTDPAPGSLFAHPVWLRTYGAGDLVIVEGRRPGAPRLVFRRRGRGLVFCGRLMRLDAALIAGLGERLTAQAGADFAVFEDVEIVGPQPAGPRCLTFHYQNNWRLPLREAGARMSRQLVSGTKRKARALGRDLSAVSIRFEPAPDRAILDRIAAFGRARIEAQGRRYGIDTAEVGRLTAVAAEVGHGTIVRAGGALLAADLICIVGDQAYFLTHGFDVAHPRSSLGMVCLITSIEACAAHGLADFNLLWGDLPYKAQLGAERVELRTVIVRRSRVALVHPGHLAAALQYGWLDMKRRLKPHVARMRLPPLRRARDHAG